MNALQDIDRQILEFSRELGHEVLAERTRSYCTPFRGTLFGQDTQAAVLERLSQRPADLLVLGANPNNSDEQRTAKAQRFRSLEDHMATGMYGEVYWDADGHPGPGWKADGTNRWQQFLYAPLQRAGVDPEAIAFANYIPWGSTPDLKQLVETLDPGLMRKVIALSDATLLQVLRILRPRLVIAQMSIHRQLPTGLIVGHLAGATAGQVLYPSGASHKAYRYFYAPLLTSGGSPTMLHLPHPASLHVTVPARQVITDHLADLFERTLQGSRRPPELTVRH